MICCLFLGAIWGLIACPAHAGSSQEDKRTETRIIRLPGSSDWTNTGVILQASDQVTISASGRICFSGNEKRSCVDADGWNVVNYPESWPEDAEYCCDPEADVNHAALIGNTGGSAFFIGRKLTFSGREGSLFVGINDCSLTGEHFPNRGTLKVLITIEHDAVPLRK